MLSLLVLLLLFCGAAFFLLLSPFNSITCLEDEHQAIARHLVQAGRQRDKAQSLNHLLKASLPYLAAKTERQQDSNKRIREAQAGRRGLKFFPYLPPSVSTFLGITKTSSSYRIELKPEHCCSRVHKVLQIWPLFLGIGGHCFFSL